MLTPKNKKAEHKEENNKTSKGRRYFRIGALFLFIAIIAGAFLLWRAFQNPAIGVIKTTSETALPTETAKITFDRFEGKYFSFHHTSDYSVREHKDVNVSGGVILESDFLATSSINSKKIAITVEDMIGRRMEDSANYNLRKINPKKYREEKFSAGGSDGIAFTAITSDVYEKVIFFFRQDYLAEISLIGPQLSDDSMDRELDDIAGSIQWKK